MVKAPHFFLLNLRIVHYKITPSILSLIIHVVV